MQSLMNIVKHGRTQRAEDNEEPAVIKYDREEYFAKYELQGMSQEKLLSEIQEEFESTIESIERYGGFWIGRYETGNLTEKNLVVQRMNSNTNGQKWYQIYTVIQGIAKQENVKTSMIFGCLWDETLQWLVESGNKTYADLVDSSSWGNYKNTQIEYKKNSTETAIKNADEGLSIPTGSAEISKTNNIYDLAGNRYEWTLESNGNNLRRLRGGENGLIGSEYPVSYRNSYFPYTGSADGARAYLYIK